MGTRVLQVLVILAILFVVIGLFSYAAAKITKKPFSIRSLRSSLAKASPTPTPTPTLAPTTTPSPTPTPGKDGNWDVGMEYVDPVVVHVLNGTDDPKVGTSMVEKIKREFGYEIGSVGDAPSDEYKETLVMDIDEEDEWKVADFARSLNADVGNVRVIETYSIGEFVVIVGSDYQKYLQSTQE